MKVSQNCLIIFKLAIRLICEKISWFHLRSKLSTAQYQTKKKFDSYSFSNCYGLNFKTANWYTCVDFTIVHFFQTPTSSFVRLEYKHFWDHKRLAPSAFFFRYQWMRSESEPVPSQCTVHQSSRKFFLWLPRWLQRQRYFLRRWI